MEHASTARSSHPTKVLIVEDYIAIRQMLALAVGEQPGFAVVGEAGDLDEALRLTRRLKPDVVVLDWVFPGGGGAAYLQALRTIQYHPRVLVLSGDTADAAIREALTNGARGYVEKAAKLEEFMFALKAVTEGRVHFGPQVAGVVERLIKRPRTAQSHAPIEHVDANVGLAPLPA